MTDYWVSTKKHYCEVCRCWVAGDNINVKKHEATPRHISSLRNKMIESHKKQVAKQKHEDFLQEELKRLNTITVDNYKNLEHIQPTGSQGMSFLPGPHLRPKIGVNEEKRKISESISRKLAGFDGPEHVDINTPKSRWTAFIDSNDGTLTYYNNFTGTKTKLRPNDFDGILPISSSSLTYNWALKYDPIKKSNYYYNSVTKEVRWVDTNTKGIQYVEEKLNKPGTEVGNTDVSSSNIYKIDTKIKREISGDVVNPDIVAINTSHSDKSESQNLILNVVKKEGLPEDDTHARKQSAAVIGNWEVVEPENTEFSHCIKSMKAWDDSSKNEKCQNDNEESTTKHPRVDDVDLKVISKPTYGKKDAVPPQNYEDSSSISFTKRKFLKKRNSINS